MDYLNWLLENLDGIFEVIAGVVLVASAVAALTPSPKDDAAVSKTGAWLAKFRTIVNLLAINVKNAKPKD